MAQVSKARLAAALITGIFIVGCAVPQPPGKGKCMYRHEPQTKRPYWLYLPEHYVKTNGKRSDGMKWPLVVTFHGMKPFDTAPAQIREWQEECDRYGFIGCAPELLTCDIFMEFPLQRVHSYVKKDEKCVLAIMDEILRTTEADPNRVLATSWSSGGYMAHYMLNRHPDRFSCLVVKQSNFSAAILDPRNVPRYRHKKIGIFYTQNDFGVCRKESEEAVRWYQRHGFSVTSGVIEAMGHERTPEVAAAQFAQTCDAQPRTPPDKLRRIQMAELAVVSMPHERAAPWMGNPHKSTAPPTTPGKRITKTSKSRRKDILFSSETQRRTRESLVRIAKGPEQNENTTPWTSGKGTKPSGVTTPRSPTATERPLAIAGPDPRTGSARHPNMPIATKTVPESVRTPQTRTRPRPANAKRTEPAQATSVTKTSPGVVKTTVARRSEDRRAPTYAIKERAPRVKIPSRTAPVTRVRQANRPASANVQVSSMIGVSPLWIAFTAELPATMQDGADFLWTDNGRPFCYSRKGTTILTEPGQHRIEVLIVTKDNRDLTAGEKVTVLPPRPPKRTKPS